MNDSASIESELSDLATPSLRIGEIVATAPEFASLAARHPNAYPELLEWIFAHGDPAAQDIARRRLAGEDDYPAEVAAEEPAMPRADGIAPIRTEVTTTMRLTVWSGAALLALGSVIGLVILTTNVIGDNTVGGQLADGASWGKRLGAETQRTSLGYDSTQGTNLVMAPDGKTVYIVDDGGVSAADPLDLDDYDYTPIETKGGLNSITLSPDGARAYLGAGAGGDTTGELIILDVNGRTLVEQSRGRLPGSGSFGDEVALSPDGADLYVSDVNAGFSRIRLSDGAVDQFMSTMSSKLAVNPVNGDAYVGNALEGTIQVFSPGAAAIRSVPIETGLPDALAVSPDGKRLVVAERHELRIYDTADFALVHVVDMNAGMSDVAFSPDSTVIAGLSEHSLRLVDAATGVRLNRIPLNGSYIIAHVTFTGEPGRILLYSDGDVVAIEAEASRTVWPGFIMAVVLLGILLVGSLLVAATMPRWMPCWIAKREAKHIESARTAARAAAEVARARERAEQLAAQRSTAMAAQEHAARVQALQGWQAAYREANGGQEPPDDFIPMMLATQVTTPPSPPLQRAGTNVMAILALIFGLGGGLLGIIFGHVALSQIKRTGENGRGLAIAGLIFGYLGLAVLAGGLIVVLVAARPYY